MSKPVVFVIGATGSIGTATLSSLSSKYQDIVEIRAGVRNPEKADTIKSLSGVTVVKACMGDDALVDVLKGVNVLFIVTPGTEKRAPLTIATAESAKKAGVKHIVLVSVPMAEVPNTILGSQLAEVEKKVSSLGVPFTFIRLPPFFSNYWVFKGTIPSQSSIQFPVDPQKKYSPVVVEDAGKAAAAILVDPSKYRNATVTVVSDIHSYGDVAAEFSKALGKEVTYTRISYEDLKKMFLGMGLPEWQAKGAVELYSLIDESHPVMLGDPAIYKEITGEDPTNLKTWVGKYAAAFQ